jgi:UDP-glucose 4-epimerase
LKRCLVTGGSGFVGSVLARRLLLEGHETHLLLRPKHEPWRLAGLTDAVRKHDVDLEDHQALGRVVATVKPDWVFHLAAYGAYSHQVGLQRMMETNLMGTAALTDASAEAGVEVFIQTGSSSEYGYKDHAAAEDETLEPNSHYAISKAAATHYCQLRARTSGFNAITVRLYSIYGPYEDPNRLIPTLIMHGLRGSFPSLVSPQIARDFVYVDDAVDAMLRIAKTQSTKRGSIYNVCSGVQSTLADAVQIAKRLMRIPGEPGWSTMQARRWDTERWVGSPTRTATEIGWCATVELEAGMRQTIEWFEAHPKLLKFYADRVFAGAA